MKTSSEAQIRQLLDARAEAIRAKDVDGVMTAYATDTVFYDALPPLRHVGASSARERVAAWLGGYVEGAPSVEIRDLTIAAGEDTGFCYYLYRVSGRLTTGTEVDMWVRATMGLQNAAGRWIITHQHDSVPFDAQTGAAVFDQAP